MNADKKENYKIYSVVVSKISFASQQNSIPIIRQIVLENNTEEPLVDAEVVLSSSPKFFENSIWRIARIDPNQRYRIQSLDIDLDAGALARMTEAEKGNISLVLQQNGEEIARNDVPIELLARNEWGGTGCFPELAAAFVQPNDPAVQRLLGKAIDVLKEHGKESYIVGYKMGKKGVWEQLAALWNTICAQRIGYVLPPASFELSGQKVRHPSEVLESRIGTCLDLTMLFASCIEQCGLNPILVFTEGHAFVGCWLNEETFSTAVVEDPTTLRKRLHLQELLLIETTLAVQQKDGPVSFKWACDKGTSHIAEDKASVFRLAVDIRRARMQRILPLSLSEGAKPKSEEDQAASFAAAPVFDEAPDFAFDITPSETAENKSPLTRLERWQRKLLDLSLRNNLLNFRANKRVVELVLPDPGDMEDRLTDGYRFRIMSSQELLAGDPREHDLHEVRHQEDLIKSLAQDALQRNQVLSSLTKQELDARLLELYRISRSSMEEGGANTLFLAMGFLSWKPGDREKSCRAPLVLIPVKLERKSVQSGFVIALHDDEPRFNLTLLEMLRKDHQISDLDSFERELPSDDHGLDIDGIWRSVQRAIKDIPGWEVSQTVALGVFSFAKYLMWKDLIDRTSDLKENPVVRHLLDTPTEKYADSGSFLEPRNLDKLLPPKKVFCPLPVDSSQLSAVATAAQGKDFVLIGPPGTGKSQTIANMIAQCLAEGKKVLFVAEKTAALNVVYRRLKAIGLGEFCLELHSHKARKVEVLEQLKSAVAAQEEFLEENWQGETSRLSTLQDRLNEYVETIHKRYPNELTPFHAIGVVVGREDMPLVRLCWPSPSFHDRAAMDQLRDVVTKIGLHGARARSLGQTSLKHVGKNDWSPVWATELGNVARELAGACDDLTQAMDALLKTSGFPAQPSDTRGLDGLALLAELLPSAVGKARSFFLRPDAAVLYSRLREGIAVIQEYRDIEAGLSVPYRRTALELDHRALLETWQLASSDWIPRLQEGLDLVREFIELSRKLSVPYKVEIYYTDVSSLKAQWDQAKDSFFLKRISLRRKVLKGLQDVAKSGAQTPDCEKDLSLLVTLQDMRNRFETLEPLSEEARELWKGGPSEPPVKIELFREAVFQTVEDIIDVPDLPLSPAAVLEKLFGVGLSGKVSSLAGVRKEISSYLKEKVIRHLLETAEADKRMIPDCEGDLNALVAMKSLAHRVATLEELRGKTEGVWDGLETDVQEVVDAATFHSELQKAVTAYADRPETLGCLLASLTNLLGPGNILLAPQGSVGLALNMYLSRLRAFKTAKNKLLQLAESDDPSWMDSELPVFADICRDIDAQQSNMNPWCAWQRVKKEATSLGLVPLMDAILSGEVAPGKESEAFEVNYCRWWLINAVEELPVLRSFVPIEHERMIKDFQGLDKRLRELARQYIRMRLRCGMFGDKAEEKHEWGVLKREMEKKKRHMPLRQLVKSIPTVLTRLTPCLLMSPLSIAQYLAPGMAMFDLVIFDEASQIPIWDAIGAMARGKRVVVVGDPKQLPPTNFFARSEDEQADEDVSQDADMESILDECLGSSLPDLKLKWHYRSRHESLITFSNHRYYEGDLVTFPAPLDEEKAVSFHHVSGIYQRGASRTNPIEAKAVVESIVARMATPGFADTGMSIGVVTFNAEQQRLIEDLLEVERRKNRSLDRFFSEEMTEPVFIKNLENVQGDERDIIYFCITYGPDQTGRHSVNFGPLNKDGGERRLNVAVTRARHEMHVFSSFTPDQIDISKTNALGVRDLKLFMEFAQRGAKAFLTEVIGSTGDFESPFEQAVAAALKSKGWTVHPQVGVSSFRVDLGIVDPDLPGRYLAGVECDGATYHRAATARDRDRLRERVLRGLGWEIVRIWSTEWWTSCNQALERIHDQLTDILKLERERRANEINDLAAGEIVDDNVVETPTEGTHFAASEHNVLTATLPYETYLDQGTQGGISDPDAGAADLDEALLIQIVTQVVNEESPIQRDALARQVARILGFSRAGRRIREAVWAKAKSMFGTTQEDVGEFYWKDVENIGICQSCRPGYEGSPRIVEEIAMPELQALARSITVSPLDDPAVLMARHLGLKKLRSSTRPRIEQAWASKDMGL